MPFFSGFLTLIFSRPWLAALIVGSVIHLLNAANLAVYADKSFIDEWSFQFQNHAAYALIALVIPFVVPWVVTHIGRRIAQLRTAEVLDNFPELNPDLIMKLDSNGTIEYMNSSTLDYLQRLGLSKERVETILPLDYREKMGSILGKDLVYTADVRYQDRLISFSFRGTPTASCVFVSGRDITDLQAVQENLDFAVNHMQEMTAFLDQIFSDYDPLRFDLQNHYRQIVAHLLREIDQPIPEKPTHIFLAEKHKDVLTGHILTLVDGEVVQDPELIEIEISNQSFAISLGQRDVVWSNWEEEVDNLAAYQSHFHPLVQEKIGTIERFATYQSGNVAIIAFYTGKRLNQTDAMVLKGLAVYSSSLQRIAEQSRETEQAFIYTMDALARASEANDEDTGDHILRINEYSWLLSETMGMGDEFQRMIRYSAQMHDVGKIHVHPDILKKPGRLTEEEFNLMKAHPVYGARILGDSPRMRMAADIAKYHHEKYSGNGYPYGLKENEIPIAARIVSLVDVYDALRQERVYKPAFSHDKAFQIITEGDGRTDPGDFDPQVLEAFVAAHRGMDEIFEQFESTELR